MRPRSFVPYLCVLGVMGAGLPALRAQGNERTVYATVLDRAGQTAEPLGVRDLTVREDGVAREILRVAPTDAPIRVAVLVDNSQAAAPFIQDFRKAVTAFVREMGEGHDISLVTFAERPTLVVDYTRNVDAVVAGADGIFSQPLSGAYLLDAIVEISEGMRKQEAGRRALVVLTTDGPEYSPRSFQQVIDELQATGASLYGVMVGTPEFGGTGRERERSFTLDRGSDATGGSFRDVRTSSSVPELFREIAVELESQFEIVYARPSSLIPPESITVEPARQGLVIRAPTKLPQP